MKIAASCLHLRTTINVWPFLAITLKSICRYAGTDDTVSRNVSLITQLLSPVSSGCWDFSVADVELILWYSYVMFMPVTFNLTLGLLKTHSSPPFVTFSLMLPSLIPYSDLVTFTKLLFLTLLPDVSYMNLLFLCFFHGVTALFSDEHVMNVHIQHPNMFLLYGCMNC